jgi:hypothetical protein
MAKGKAKVNYLGREGLVTPQSAPSWDFIYETSTVRNSNYNIGDHVHLPDGREFVYAKSSAACGAGQGCEFTATGYTGYTAFAVAGAIGAKSVTVTAATHAALTEDELRGGYIIIYAATDDYCQFRGIIGNDAAAANALFVVYLDGPLTYAVTASTSACETFQNPYAALRKATEYSYAVAGVPATYVSAASKYFWVQKKGPCRVAPTTSNVGENGGLGCFWRHNGALEGAEVALAVTVPAADTSQYAGHTIEGSQAGNGPLFMLQG